MDSAIVVAIITGIFGAIVAPIFNHLLIRSRSSDSVAPTPPISPWFIAVIVAAGAALGGIIGFFTIAPLFSPVVSSWTAPRVSINSPIDGSKAGPAIIITGSAKNVPPGRYLWLLVQPEGTTQYHPQPGPISVTADGSWGATAYLGDNVKDQGKKFMVIVVMGDSRANSQFQSYLVDVQTVPRLPLH